MSTTKKKQRSKRLTRAQFISWLADRNACMPAMDWLAKTKGAPASIWKALRRPDWAVWMLDAALPGTFSTDDLVGIDIVDRAVGCHRNDARLARKVTGAVPWRDIEAEIVRSMQPRSALEAA